MMSPIFSKRLLSIFIIGICVIFTMKTAAQMRSLAERVFQKHQTVLLSEDVQAVLPEALVEFKKPEHQELLTPTLIEAVLENPDLLKIIIPEISDEFITLLKQEDSDLRILISDPDVQTLLQMPDAIDELVYLIETAESSLATRIFRRYELLFQRADIRELLPDVLTALKQPDTQALLQPAMIKLIAENPELLKVIVPEIDDRFITLIKEDPEVNILINDPDLHVLLQNPADIDELAVLLDLDTVAIVGIVPASIEFPEVGDEFTIAVVTTNAQNVRGYQLSVQFDPEALRYVAWQHGSYLSDDVFAAPAIVEADRVSFIVAAPVKTESTQDLLLTVTFEVVAAKTSMLSLNDVVLVSGEGIALPVKTEGSEIVAPISVETSESEAVEPTPSESEEGEIVDSVPVETSESEAVEPIPSETEDSEMVEPISEGAEDEVEPTSAESGAGEVVDSVPVETSDGEAVEPTSTDTEDSETVEPVSEGTEDEVDPTSTESEDGEVTERLTPAWDVNADRFVNVLDLVLVARGFGEEGPTPADVNGDNVVNILDLTLVASHLGEYYGEP